LRRHKVLIVDDEAANLRLLQRVLNEHDVLTAQSGAEALKLLKAQDISLIISDQRMPQMTGVKLLEESIALRPYAIKILLTGYTDIQALVDAINAGKVYKYISKPWDPEELRLTVKRALESYELREDNENLLIDLKLALAQLEELSMATIKALSDALDAKCDYTSGHSVRVSRLALGIGRALGLPHSELRDLELGGILHDIGKIGVPESILWKASRLNGDEQLIMANHPCRSAQIIGELKGLSRTREYVLHHHEYMDGTGYPDHLVGEAIPLGSRIILVADAYDAMTTDRPYRQAIGHEKALVELKKHGGKQFDQNVIEALIMVAGEGRELETNENLNSVLGLSFAPSDPELPDKPHSAQVQCQSPPYLEGGALRS